MANEEQADTPIFDELLREMAIQPDTLVTPSPTDKPANKPAEAPAKPRPPGRHQPSHQPTGSENLRSPSSTAMLRQQVR